LVGSTDQFYTALVRVTSVRAKGRGGALFRGQRITDDGEIIDPDNGLTVSIYSRFNRGVEVDVLPGQWWRIKGPVKSGTFINAGGFEMTEDHMVVEPEDAALVMPSGAHVVDYLKRNPRFHGIGKVTAERLWEAFKDTLFGALDEGDIDALAEIVGRPKATMLVDGWREENLSNSLQWLQIYGIDVRTGRRILDYFGQYAAEKITENPYRLLSFAAGWKEVDNLARTQLRVELDDPRRLAAAIEEAVYRRFSHGDTVVSRRDLIAGLRAILDGEGHSRELIEKAIRQSEDTRRLLFDQEGNAYSLGASILENQIVDSIRIRLGRVSVPCDVDGIIRAYEGRIGHGFQLNKEQREAVHLIAENDFAVVTGGAGVGKTTVLKCVHEVLEDQGYKVVQSALTGKAVKRMMEATEKPAITIASFISQKRKAESRGEVDSDKTTELVIDEASMVDLISFNGVIRVIGEDTKIVLIGDPSQLPPVGPGLILHCLVEVPGIPHVELKVAKRFGNQIADGANSIKDGVFPSMEQFKGDLRFIEAGEAEMAGLAAQLYLEQPDDTVVLCATRKVAKDINERIHAPLCQGRKPIRKVDLELDAWIYAGFYEGDLVICTQNHWDLGIQNGSIGRLVEVIDNPLGEAGQDDAGPPVIGWILWDDGERRPLHENLLDSLELGYALTCHKSQGSEWRRVIICLPASNKSRLIERSLVYTAITRSRAEIVMLGNHAHLSEAIGREKAADRRNVGLTKRLRHAFPCQTDASVT